VVGPWVVAGARVVVAAVVGGFVVTGARVVVLERASSDSRQAVSHPHKAGHLARATQEWVKGQ
jgi:hypothetical protein